MSAYIADPFIAEAEKQSADLIAASDSALKKCGQKLKKAEEHHKKFVAQLKCADAHLTELEVKQLSPSILKAAKQLPEAEFQLRCVRYDLANEKKEAEKVKARLHEVSVHEFRLKKENKKHKQTIDELNQTVDELKQTFDELTAEPTGEVKVTQVTEKAAMEKEIAMLKEQVMVKTKEGEVYKTELDEMRDYANYAVTLLNNAWRDGADRMEHLYAQLHAQEKDLAMKKWCEDV